MPVLQTGNHHPIDLHKNCHQANNNLDGNFSVTVQVSLAHSTVQDCKKTKTRLEFGTLSCILCFFKV